MEGNPSEASRVLRVRLMARSGLLELQPHDTLRPKRSRMRWNTAERRSAIAAHQWGAPEVPVDELVLSPPSGVTGP